MNSKLKFKVNKGHMIELLTHNVDISKYGGFMIDGLVRLEIKDESLTASSGNMYMSGISKMSVKDTSLEIEEKGSVIITGTTLLNIISSFDDGIINFECKHDDELSYIMVNQGKKKYKINSFSDDNLPNFGNNDYDFDLYNEIDGHLITNILSKTSKLIDRKTMNFIVLRIDENSCFGVGASMSNAVFCEYRNDFDAKLGEERSLYIHGETIKFIEKLANRTDLSVYDKDDKLHLFWEKAGTFHTFIIKINIDSRMDFYDLLKQLKFNGSFFCNKAELENALKMIMIMQDKVGFVYLSLNEKDMTVRLKSTKGTAVTSIDIEYEIGDEVKEDIETKEDIKVEFECIKLQYECINLLTGIGLIEGDVLQIFYKDTKSPILIKSPDSDSDRVVLSAVKEV